MPKKLPSLWVFLAVVSALHGLFLLLPFCRSPLPERTVSVPIDLIPEAQLPSARRSSGKGRAAGSKGDRPSGASKLSLQALMPTDLAVSRGNETTGTASEGRKAAQGSYMDSSGPLEKSAPLIPFFHAVWEKIHQDVGYPNEFVDRNVEGDVHVSLVLDGKGALLPEFIKITTTHDYLQAYVLAMLLRSLETPLPDRFWHKHGPMRFSLKFEFKTFTHRNQRREEPGDEKGNLLFFRKHAYRDAKIDKAISRFLDKFMPPILPIPGGFIIDFVKLYRMVDAYLHPKMDEVDQEHLRLALFRQKLDLMISKKSPRPN